MKLHNLSGRMLVGNHINQIMLPDSETAEVYRLLNEIVKPDAEIQALAWDLGEALNSMDYMHAGTIVFAADLPEEVFDAVLEVCCLHGFTIYIPQEDGSLELIV